MRLSNVMLVFTAATVCFAASAAAQSSPSLENAQVALRLRPASHPLGGDRSLVTLPDSVGHRKKDYTVLGLVIGGGLGFAAGWAFYDMLCEAVDNHCGNPRTGTVLLGTAAGATLGLLAGSVLD